MRSPKFATAAWLAVLASVNLALLAVVAYTAIFTIRGQMLDTAALSGNWLGRAAFGTTLNSALDADLRRLAGAGPAGRGVDRPAAGAVLAGHHGRGAGGRLDAVDVRPQDLCDHPHRSRGRPRAGDRRQQPAKRARGRGGGLRRRTGAGPAPGRAGRGERGRGNLRRGGRRGDALGGLAPAQRRDRVLPHRRRLGGRGRPHADPGPAQERGGEQPGPRRLVARRHPGGGPVAARRRDPGPAASRSTG